MCVCLVTFSSMFTRQDPVAFVETSSLSPKACDFFSFNIYTVRMLVK